MSKKKVLFITPSLCQGGREQSLITMLKLLDENKYDITLFTYKDDLSLMSLIPNNVKFINETIKPHCFRKLKALVYNAMIFLSDKSGADNIKKNISQKLKQYVHNQKIMYPARRFFNRKKYDVIISYAIGFCSEVAINIKAEKHILFFHNSVDLHHDLMVKQIPLYDKLVAVSAGVNQLLLNNYDNVKNKIIVINNYVDAVSIIDKAIEKIEIKYQGLKLCTCGRLSKEKGFDLALSSAKLLKEKGVDFRWYFVGDGEERENLEAIIDDMALNNHIIITGFKSNPFPYMKLCDIYIQPSYNESFGLTIKEAIILGKAVISTDTVGGRAVLEGGKYGQIVPVSAEGIVEGIYNIFNNSVQSEKYSIAKNKIEKNNYIKEVNELLNI